MKKNPFQYEWPKIKKNICISCVEMHWFKNMFYNGEKAVLILVLIYSQSDNLKKNMYAYVNYSTSVSDIFCQSDESEDGSLVCLWWWAGRSLFSFICRVWLSDISNDSSEGCITFRLGIVVDAAGVLRCSSCSAQSCSPEQ